MSSNKDKTKVFHFLKSFKGFDFKTIQLICYECGISKKSLIRNITKAQKNFILNWMDANLFNLVFGEKLVKVGSEYRKNLADLDSVRSFRFFNRLPVNGQRTKTNAKTAKKLNGHALCYL